MNKIKYGLKNVHYAVATIATNGSATYGTPAALPGAVSISMDPQGDTTKFYADNVVYWVGVANNGYEGDLEVALIPDDFKKNILGYITDAGNVLVEDVNATPVHFALTFQFEGDVNATKHVLYNCTAARPTAAGSTKEDSIEPQTETITITATSIYNASLNKDIVKAEANQSTASTAYAAWETAIYTATSA